MKTVHIGTEKYFLRNALRSDVPHLRALVNSAYKELSDMGLNYTATYQDEDITLKRIEKGIAFVLLDEARIVATVLLSKENHITNRNTGYISQFAVTPQLKKNRIGSFLMSYCEQQAQASGFEGVQLDTAIPASHLVNWYQKLGYAVVGEIQWDGKTYKSYIFEKIFKLN